MTPTLIVMGFLAMGVAIVAFATRHVPARRTEEQLHEETVRGEPAVAQEPVAHPFAHAPVLRTVPEPANETERLS